ncbi:MAG: pantoate--beta-alanine ligase [Gaiellaceae bacterium]
MTSRLEDAALGAPHEAQGSLAVARTIRELRELLDPWRARSRIGLVPTMGAFHEGHLALMRAARTECDRVVVSLFVNPTQFGPGEDLGRYPRDEGRDLRLAREAGVDVVFAPPADELYPSGFQTWVEVAELSAPLEGELRPGHFRGVATVCLKLFNVVRPQAAYFGQKDAQQLALIRRLVRDLDLEIEIRAVPTVRDPDGLALSSRNAYLGPEERAAALALPRALQRGAGVFGRGDAVAAARAVLDAEPGLSTQYVEIAELEGQRVLAAAVSVGSTRLIDNVVLEETRP